MECNFNSFFINFAKSFKNSIFFIINLLFLLLNLIIYCLIISICDREFSPKIKIYFMIFISLRNFWMLLVMQSFVLIEDILFHWNYFNFIKYFHSIIKYLYIYFEIRLQYRYSFLIIFKIYFLLHYYISHELNFLSICQ
jgi:hypothetical protein